MGSHKQRVQRKIKKEVKRKIQAKQRPSHAQQTQNKMDEMMKMLLMLKGGQQQNPNAAQNLLTAKEIIAKQNAEEARKQRETTQRIKQIEANENAEKMKAKTQQYEEEEKHRRNMIELENQLREAQAKLREVKNEKEEAALKAKIATLQQQYDLERQNLELELRAAGLDAAGVDARHETEEKRGEIKRMQLELQIKQKQYDIEDSEAKAKELANELTKIKAEVTEYSKINTRGNQKYKDFIAELDATIDTLKKGALKSMVDISTAKDQIKNLQKYNIDKLIGTGSRLNTELKKVLRETKSELNDLTEDNEHLHALNKENKQLQRDIASTQYNINLENAQTRTKNGELQIYVQTSYKGEDGTVYTSKMWKNAEDVDWNVDTPFGKDIAKDLETAEVDNKQYKTIKKQVDAEYDRNEKDLLKIDELNAENKHIIAYNDAMGDVKYDDKSAEIAKLEYEIKEIQEKINDKWTSRADYNKMLRQIKELQNKKTALEKELEMTPEQKITAQQIKNRAELMNSIATTEAAINKKHAKGAAVDKFENDTEQLKTENDLKQEMLKTMDDRKGSDLKKIVKERTDAVQKEKLLAAQEAAKNAQDRLNEVKWQEEALKAPEIEATNKRIQQEHANKAKYEAHAIALDRYYREHEVAQQAQATLNVHKQMLNTFSDTQGIADAEAMLTVANDKINDLIKDMSAEEKYINDKNDTFRTNLSTDAPLLELVKQVFGKHNVGIDSPEWFKNNLKTREQVDTFNNIVGTVRGAYNDDEQRWHPELLDNNVDIDNNLKILLDSWTDEVSDSV